jgi:hypothetical protein
LSCKEANKKKEIYNASVKFHDLQIHFNSKRSITALTPIKTCNNFIFITTNGTVVRDKQFQKKKNESAGFSPHLLTTSQQKIKWCSFKANQRKTSFHSNENDPSRSSIHQSSAIVGSRRVLQSRSDTCKRKKEVERVLRASVEDALVQYHSRVSAFKKNAALFGH